MILMNNKSLGDVGMKTRTISFLPVPLLLILRPVAFLFGSGYCSILLPFLSLFHFEAIVLQPARNRITGKNDLTLPEPHRPPASLSYRVYLGCSRPVKSDLAESLENRHLGTVPTDPECPYFVRSCERLAHFRGRR